MVEGPSSRDPTLALFPDGVIVSERQPGVAYRLVRRIGEGGTSFAYYAMREAPEGRAPVVVKVLRPAIVRDSDALVLLTVAKESVALARLNELVPPTPFVVRFLETGTHATTYLGKPIDVPWLVVEYVHGGGEGATLTERIANATRATGRAFDAQRASRAVECIGRGLAAVHEVGVIHRDVKPDNVLCCGAIESEIFKVSDFGLARPLGMSATFGAAIAGTPGYVAPERLTAQADAVGTWTDVFGFGALVFAILAGEEYFPARSLAEGVAAALKPERRPLLDGAFLSPELRARPKACRAIDEVLAQATAADPARRLASVERVASEVVAILDAESRRAVAPAAQRLVVNPTAAGTRAWQWTTRHEPTEGVMLRSVAWESDGKCLAATDRGLAFWDGTRWNEAPTRGVAHAEALRVVRHVAPGLWAIAGEGPDLTLYATGGEVELLRDPRSPSTYAHFDGQPSDLAIAVGTSRAGELALFGLVGKRWLAPVALTDVASVNGIARLDDVRWMFCGRTRRGGAFVAAFEPLDARVTMLAAPPTRALIACAAAPAAGVGYVVGSDGVVVRVAGAEVTLETVERAAVLTSVAVDASGQVACGAAGRIWTRSPKAPSSPAWALAWESSAIGAPLVSLYADVGLVVGVSADGAVVEGARVTG